jgi:multidrug efflux pump
VSLIAVFIPLLFMTGVVGRMFREFALTLTIAVVVSAIISLTLTPMMCAKLLRGVPHGHGGGGFGARLEALTKKLDDLYEVTLHWALARQRFMLLLTLATLGLTLALYAYIPKGFLPRQDTSLLTAVLESAPDASFEAMTRLQGEVSAIFEKDPEVTGVASVLGVGALNATTNVGRMTITLRGRNLRSLSADRVAERLKHAAAGVAGATLYIEPVQDIQITSRSSRSQYQYTLTAADGGELTEWSERLLEKLRADPRLRNVAAETPTGGLRSFLHIDRERMGRMGITTQNVDDILNDAFGQRQISTIYAQSNQYRVVLEAAPHYQRDPRALEKLYVAPTGQGAGLGGGQTPLGTFARFELISAPLAVAHQEQFPAATLSFDLGERFSLEEALALIATTEREIGMPNSIMGSFSADAAEFRKSLESEPWLILAAIITIYVVLGVLYESFAHPFTVLTTLPSAGVGALLALIVTDHDMSIVALIGVVLLMGIVKKNAIMMIDFALEAERIEGLAPDVAIEKACLLRFRPIIMTTLAALLGALPLALSEGAGSELRIPLGVSIIGGLLLSQLLTLYTTPVIYLAVERLRRRLGGAGQAEETAPQRAAAPADAASDALRNEAAE